MQSHRYDALERTLLDLIAQDDCPDDQFNTLALDLFSFQFEQNTPYRRYCEQLGVTRPPDHWTTIPALPLEAFRHREIRSFSAPPTAIFHTSGTTAATPGRHFFLRTALYETAILRAWDLFHLPVLEQLILTPGPEHAPQSSLAFMMGVLSARTPAGAQRFVIDSNGELDLPTIDSQLSGRTEPLLIMGTALAFLRLFEHYERHNLQFSLPPGSLALETGGYKGSRRSLTKPDLYAMFTLRLGLPPEAIVNEYGMTELSSQFYSRGLGQPHWSPPWTRAIVVHPENGQPCNDGETGILKIWDLANLGSVAVLQTRDLATRRGDAFELIGRDPAALPRGCSIAAHALLAS
jgi:hypothetical protein